MKPRFSEEHIAAINCRRRIIVNFDVIHADSSFTQREIEALVKHRFTFVDAPGTHIDRIWWNWCEGNQVPYPSEVLPLFDHPGYSRWVEEGTDIVRIFPNPSTRS